MSYQIPFDCIFLVFPLPDFPLLDFPLLDHRRMDRYRLGVIACALVHFLARETQGNERADYQRHPSKNPNG